MRAEPGLLLVDKPVGATSHQVVRMARHALGQRRIGHTGTLDPFATGLLLLAVGTFTRAVEYFHTLRKTYRATLCLGQETDTEDHTGTVTSESDRWRDLGEQEIVGAARARVGAQDQVPSKFSAKRIDGVRAYSRARQGEDIEIPPVAVMVHELRVLTVRLPVVEVEVTVSTGTYVRALARDLGRDLGCGAHLTDLRRTRIGPFDVGDAYAADAIPTTEGLTQPGWRSAARALSWMTCREVAGPEIRDLEAGRPVPAVDGALGHVALVAADRLVAIGEVDGAVIRPRKVFPT